MESPEIRSQDKFKSFGYDFDYYFKLRLNEEFCFEFVFHNSLYQNFLLIFFI